ncbi:hypothetical protein GCM10027203_10690 [Nonomuraea fastidiosa]
MRTDSSALTGTRLAWAVTELGEQLAGDQDDAWLAGVQFQRDLRRDLVVDAGWLRPPLLVDLRARAGEDKHRRAR